MQLTYYLCVSGNIPLKFIFKIPHTPDFCIHFPWTCFVYFNTILCMIKIEWYFSHISSQMNIPNTSIPFIAFIGKLKPLQSKNVVKTYHTSLRKIVCFGGHSFRNNSTFPCHPPRRRKNVASCVGRRVSI